ncbi:cytochrome P450 6a17, partial [Asbolus verrucosus]
MYEPDPRQQPIFSIKFRKRKKENFQKFCNYIQPFVRRSVKNYNIPDEDTLIVKVDEEYYPHPQKFNPEPFRGENRKSRPFGEVPRTCRSILAVVLGYCKWAHQYWRRKKIPYLEPHLPFGNISNVVKRKEDIGTTIKQMYDEMKRRNWKHGGVYFFLSANYVLIDLDYIKNILTRDFNYFVDHPFYSNEKIEPVNGNLLNIRGEKWRKLRTKLTPTFTTAKMKMMFGTMLDCGVNLLGRVEEKCQRDEAIDIKDVLESFTMDIIRSCAFGLDLKLSEEDDSSFKIYSKKMLVVTKWQFIKSEFVSDFPRLANILRLKVLPKGVADFFLKTVTDIIEFREKNSVVRNDFMQLMIKLKNSKFVEESLTIEEIAAQSALFITASFETSSILMTFTMYELAKNQNIQNEIRDEISSVLGNYEGKITYSALGEMKYMNKVLDGGLIFLKMLVGVVIALFITVIFYYKWTYQYWRRKNLKYLEPQMPYGNLTNLVHRKEHIGLTIKRFYDEMKTKGWKHGGLYFILSPNYLVVDLDYVKNIMTKDFQHFVDRNIYYNEKDDPLSAHLVNVTGTRWRNLRSKLTPTFTSGKMKMMFQTLVECEANLQKQMEAKCAKSIDIKDVLARFTTDIIGSCAFGLDCKAFEDEDSPFRTYGKKIFAITRGRRLKRNFANSFPALARMLGVCITPKDVADFYMKVVKDT